MPSPEFSVSDFDQARYPSVADDMRQFRGVSNAWAAAPIAANLADFATTRMALSRPGLKEGNGLLKGIAGDPLKLLAFKLALGGGTALASKLVGKKNKTAGKVISAAGTAIPAALSVNNTIQMLK